MRPLLPLLPSSLSFPLVLTLAALASACGQEPRKGEGPAPAQAAKKSELGEELVPEPAPPSEPSKPAKPSKPTPPKPTPGQSPSQSPFQGESHPLTIKGIKYTGDGCPAGTVANNISPDAEAFTLIFAEFLVTLDPGAPAGKGGYARASRRCVVDLELQLPHGWQMTILAVDRRGYADIPAGGEATLATSISFPGGQGRSDFTRKITGPFSDDFAVHDEARLSTLTWSPCGRTATLRLDVGAALATTGGLGATLGLDSLDGELRHEMGLAWRRCQ